MTKQTLLIILFLASYVAGVFSQTIQTDENKTKPEKNTSNLLDKIILTFDLAAEPKPEDVGFDYPKSSWKLVFELRLSDEKTLNKLNSGLYDDCRQNTSDYRKCVSKANKTFDQKSKKSMFLVFKGIFEKKDLAVEENRQTLIPVNFTPQVIEIFNRAAQTQENPTFILRVKSKVSAKLADQKKYKRKQSISFQYPLKLIRKDGSFDYYNITTFGASVRIYKDESGGIGYGIFRN